MARCPAIVVNIRCRGAASIVVRHHCLLAREAFARANEHVRRAARIIADWRKAA